MEILISGWLFILGLALGSFINVIIYRTIKGESPFKGRSYCDHCGKLVGWRENIPLFSFLVLRGRCSRCRKKIPLQYPVVELLTGLLFVWWYWIGKAVFLLTQSPLGLLQPAFWLIVGLMLLMVFIYDLIYGIIPDFLSGGLLGLAIVYRLFLAVSGAMRWQDVASSVNAGLLLMAFFFGLYLLTKRRGFGFGDVKLAPALGLLLGWQKTIVGVMAAFIIGALVGSLLIGLKKKRLGQTVPFGPFLVVGTLLALVWGGVIWAKYWSFVYP